MMPDLDEQRPPLVAVIVPVFNRLELLRSTVASLQAQTLTDAEFILVDDNSEESVWDFLCSLAADDPRFRAMRKDLSAPRGPQASRNAGLDAASADAVIMLDSDDLLEPHCLETRLAMLASNPQADVLVGRQAIISAETGSVHWVNIPKPLVNDLDRFLELAHPPDVPWVNGGAIFRTQSLLAAKVRFRPEFEWDDVAFHFECLVAGLRTIWMPYDGEPDAFYLRHGANTRGQELFTLVGIRNSASMFEWMLQRLAAAGQASEGRRESLARAFYGICALPAIDASEHELARQMITSAAAAGLLSRDEALALRFYRVGRMTFRRFRRLTYYWNRLADKMLLQPFLTRATSTYDSIPVARTAA